jgi:hypothetical protein
MAFRTDITVSQFGVGQERTIVTDSSPEAHPVTLSQRQLHPGLAGTWLARWEVSNGQWAIGSRLFIG